MLRNLTEKSMKIWPICVKIPKWGLCEVRETTDRETTQANRKSINYAPRSMGCVNLFQDDVFRGWCGIAFAKRHLIDKKAKLPKYIRDIPI